MSRNASFNILEVTNLSIGGRYSKNQPAFMVNRDSLFRRDLEVRGTLKADRLEGSGFELMNQIHSTAEKIFLTDQGSSRSEPLQNLILEMESVGGIKLPRGVTNDRPTQDDDRYIGTIRYNLTSNEFEGYYGGLIGWQNIGNRFIQTDSSASGDIIQTISSES